MNYIMCKATEEAGAISPQVAAGMKYIMCMREGQDVVAISPQVAAGMKYIMCMRD
jgi:hypothetical protein